MLRRTRRESGSLRRVAFAFVSSLTSACALILAAGCTTPAPAPSAESFDVRIPAADGVILAGTLSRPARLANSSAARAPVVVLVSGSGPQDRDGARDDLPGYRPFRDLAGALGAQGIAVLRMDDRGTGASSGRFAGATTLDFARDLEAAIAWLRGRTDVDGARPALIGHSEGALVSLIAASRDSAIAALVLLGASSRTGRELARWQRTALVSSDPAAFPASSRAMVLAAAEQAAEAAARGDAWLRTWFDLDPRQIARDTRAPALLLHGENDRQVPVEQAGELAAALRARVVMPQQPPATVLVQRFPHTDHLMLEDHDGDPRGYVRLAERSLRASVVSAIVEWLPPRLGVAR